LRLPAHRRPDARRPRNAPGRYGRQAAPAQGGRGHRRHAGAPPTTHPGKKQLLDRLQAGAAADHPGWANLPELNRQIQEATDRLAEYQVQQQGLN
jgi:hypothetical protein